MIIIKRGDVFIDKNGKKRVVVIREEDPDVLVISIDNMCIQPLILQKRVMEEMCYRYNLKVGFSKKIVDDMFINAELCKV